MAFAEALSGLPGVTAALGPPHEIPHHDRELLARVFLEEVARPLDRHVVLSHGPGDARDQGFVRAARDRVAVAERREEGTLELLQALPRGAVCGRGGVLGR